MYGAVQPTDEDCVPNDSSHDEIIQNSVKFHAKGDGVNVIGVSVETNISDHNRNFDEDFRCTEESNECKSNGIRSLSSDTKSFQYEKDIDLPKQIFKLSPYRYYVLAAFSLQSFINSWLWITWSPFVSLCMEVWNVSDAEVDSLSSVFMYIYIPFAFPALYIVHTFGLKLGLYLSSALTLAGSIYRVIGFEDYRDVYFGTVLCALAQTFILSTPPFLAGEWFGSTERATATSVGVMSNQFGIAVGLGSSIFVSAESKSSLFKYVFMQSIFSFISMILIVLWVKHSRPEAPPSLAKVTSFKLSHESPKTLYFNVCHEYDENYIDTLISKQSKMAEHMNYADSFKLFFADSSNILFGVIYGVVVGVFYAICTFLSQYVPYSPIEYGFLGALFIVVGSFGNLIAGYILDNSLSCHRSVAYYSVTGCLLSMMYFTIAIWLFSSMRLQVYSSLLINGILLSALISDGFEYATAIAYPADENIVAGILNCSAQVFGWLMVYIGGSMKFVDGYMYNSILVSFLFCSVLVFSYCVKATSKRPNI